MQQTTRIKTFSSHSTHKKEKATRNTARIKKTFSSHTTRRKPQENRFRGKSDENKLNMSKNALLLYTQGGEIASRAESEEKNDNIATVENQKILYIRTVLEPLGAQEEHATSSPGLKD